LLSSLEYAEKILPQCNMPNDQKSLIKIQLDTAINLIRLKHDLNEARLIYDTIDDQLVRECSASISQIAPPSSPSDGSDSSDSGPNFPPNGQDRGGTLGFGGLPGGPPLGLPGPTDYLSFSIWSASIISTIIFALLWYISYKRYREGKPPLILKRRPGRPTEGTIIEKKEIEWKKNKLS
jgi:hypothetical protein